MDILAHWRLLDQQGKSFQLIGPVELKNDAGESIGTRVTIKIQDNSLDDKD